MRTCLRQLLLMMLGLLACLGASAEDSLPRWGLSCGRSKGTGPERRARFRKNPRMLYVEWGKEEEIIEFLLKHRDKMVWSVDDNGHTRYCSLRDLEWERRSDAWSAKGCREHLIAPPIAGYEGRLAFGGNVAQLPGSLRFLADKEAVQRLADPGGGSQSISVSFVSAGASEDELLHEIMRRHVLGNPRVTREGDNVLLESDGDYGRGYSVTWRSGKNLVVHIAGRRKSGALLRAYLAKHPSSLPKDLEVDSGRWALEELERCVQLMKAHARDPNRRMTESLLHRFDTGHSRIGRYFDVGPWWRQYGRRGADLYKEHVAGTEWRSDYDTYWKKFLELRQEQIGHVEEMLEKAKVGIKFTTVGRRRFIVGEKPPGASLLSPKVVVPLAAIGIGGAVGFAWTRRRARGA